MGDDYDFLVTDIFNGLDEIIIEPMKAARKIRRIQNILTEWKRREADFKGYRK